MQGKECNNSQEIGREKESLIEDISIMVLSILENDGEPRDLDSMENALTPILAEIRKKATEQHFQSQDPTSHNCAKCGEKTRLKENLSRVITGLSRYEIKRHSFYCPECDEYTRPLDKILNLSGRFTLEIRKAMLLLGQRIPFQEASDYLNKLLRVQVSDQSVLTLVESVGKAIHEEDLQMVRNTLDKDGFVKGKWENDGDKRNGLSPNGRHAGSNQRRKVERNSKWNSIFRKR